MLFSRLKMLTTVAVMAVSCLSAAHAADPLKAGFVYIGPTGDHGWTYSHDQGRKALEAQARELFTLTQGQGEIMRRSPALR